MDGRTVKSRVGTWETFPREVSGTTLERLYVESGDPTSE